MFGTFLLSDTGQVAEGLLKEDPTHSFLVFCLKGHGEIAGKCCFVAAQEDANVSFSVHGALSHGVAGHQSSVSETAGSGLPE